MTQFTANRAPAGLVSGATATAIVIADMVGIGVFTSLGFQVGDIKSGFALLLLWIVGGAVALCGALCYAELATMLPRSSGEYNFLRRIYHPAFGFVAGWLSATVGFAAPIALAAMAFGVYFKALAPNAPPLLLGLGLTWVLALVHLCGVQVAGAFHNAWTIFKLAPIVIFIVSGFAIGDAQPISFAPHPGDLAAVVSAPFAISLVFVMYSYSGWNAATYIVGELRDPGRNLPRALLIGTAVVIVLYVALNAVMLATTPLPELAGQLDVAMVAGRHIFGPLGARFVGGLISLGLVSSISAMMWIGPRVTMTMGEDMPALRLFARKSKTGVPAIAIVFQVLVADLLLLTQSFEAVLDFIQFSLTFCSFFTVLGLIKMRITHPDLVRPYRAWGYPITPLVFLSLTLFIMYYLVVNRPLQSLGGLGLMAAGLVIYYASKLISNVPPSDSDSTIPSRPTLSTVPRLFAAALFAGFLALAIAPARSAETATANDTARFLAGLPPAPDSPLAALAKDPGWAQHARFFDSIFTREDATTLSKVRAFSKEHLTSQHDTMLYMFSGPDFLYATSFFPSASTYVLAGLEPVGAVPQLTSLPRGAVDASLHNIEGSLASILNLSFFITKNMKTQLTTGPVYGTLPILYVFLARTGKTVHEVSLVNVDGQGNVVAAEEPGTKARAATQSAAKGVKIVFSDGSGPQQTLYYFSTDLSDGGVKSSGFLQFCAKFGVADSFIKSASYLLHSGGFTRVRRFLIDRSATILQDDSGIPLAYFDAKQWRLQPFGHYLHPLGIFPNAYQPDMAELFRTAAPLDFGIGYLWRKNESNLLLATRTAPGPSEAEINQLLTTGSDSASATGESPKPHRKRSQTAANPPPRPDGLRGFFGSFGVDDRPARPRPPK